MIHKMKLYNGPYELIKNGIKTIELRLNDEKRKKIKIGDTVLFINVDTQKWLAVKVKELHYENTFKQLFERVCNKKAMGFLDENESVEDMVSNMRNYYSEILEKENGVVGIKFETPKVEMDFPVKCDEKNLKYVIIVAFHKGKMVFCKHKERKTIELPGGHIEKGETALEAAKRELYEETGISDVQAMIPIVAYQAKATTYESKGAYGMLYAAEINKIPDNIPDFEMEKTELYDLNPYKKRFDWILPEVPGNLTHYEVYSVVLYFVQRMLLNDDLLFDEEEIEYYERLKYYEEEVCVDYESFDADSYLHYVVMRTDCDDYWSPLEKLAPTEENYKEIRDELIFSCELFEFFTILVDKFGKEKVRNDEKLMKKIYKVFEKEIVDAVFDE